MLYDIKRMFVKVFRQLFYIFPIKKNRIVFMNFSGRGYGDNPKYIAEYLLENGNNLEIVWLANIREDDFPSGINVVKFGSIKAYFMLGTAKIWIDNVRYLKGIKKKRTQIYIQTWHASYSQKKLEKSAELMLGLSYVKAAKKDGKIADIMISNSKLQTKDIRDNFWFNGKILECGYPRNDILINSFHNTWYIEKIKIKLFIPRDSKVVMFAPTFRDSEDMDHYILDYKKISENASIHYGKKTVVLVRLHPNVAGMAEKIVCSENIINVTYYPDMQELLLISDLLITDYSSSIFDIMLIEHDVIIYANDIEKYNKTRGLKQMFWNLPFPIIESEEQLYDMLKQCNQYNDWKKIKEFKKIYGVFDDGKGSKTVGDYIMELLENRR